MLIIAIPESASTAMMHALAEATGLPCRQNLSLDLPIPENFLNLDKYHSDLRDYPLDTLKEFGSQNTIFKQHIPPTKQNVKSLSETKKVILLKDPKQVIESYYRADKKAMHPKRPEFEGCKTMSQWCERADKIGFLGDLNRLCEGWKEASTDQRTIIVDCDKLIADTEKSDRLYLRVL